MQYEKEKCSYQYLFNNQCTYSEDCLHFERNVVRSLLHSRNIVKRNLMLCEARTNLVCYCYIKAYIHFNDVQIPEYDFSQHFAAFLTNNLLDFLNNNAFSTTIVNSTVACITIRQCATGNLYLLMCYTRVMFVML